MILRRILRVTAEIISSGSKLWLVLISTFGLYHHWSLRAEHTKANLKAKIYKLTKTSRFLRMTETSGKVLETYLKGKLLIKEDLWEAAELVFMSPRTQGAVQFNRWSTTLRAVLSVNDKVPKHLCVLLWTLLLNMQKDQEVENLHFTRLDSHEHTDTNFCGTLLKQNIMHSSSPQAKSEHFLLQQGQK